MINDDTLKHLLDNETWITPQEALDWGFATSITGTAASAKAAASAFSALFEMVIAAKAARILTVSSTPVEPTGEPSAGEDPEPPETDPEPEPEPEPENQAALKRAAFLRGSINYLRKQ